MPLDPSLRPADFMRLSNLAQQITIASCILHVFPIATFLCVRRSYPARLPVYFCVASLGLALSLLLGFLFPNACYWQGVGTQFFAVAMVVFWLCVTFNLYRASFNEPVAHLEASFVTLGWLVPVPFTAVPMALELFQTPASRDPWQQCWLRSSHTWAPWVFLFGGMLLASILGLYWFLATLRQVYRYALPQNHVGPGRVVGGRCV